MAPVITTIEFTNKPSVLIDTVYVTVVAVELIDVTEYVKAGIGVVEDTPGAPFTHELRTPFAVCVYE